MPSSPSSYLSLVGDIGGTNSRLQMVLTTVVGASSQFEEKIEYEKTFSSKSHPSMESVVESFLSEFRTQTSLPSPPPPLIACCLAVAGPVSDNRVSITNLGWPTIDGSVLRQRFKIPFVQIINDFVAVGFGLLALAPSQIEVLQRGDSSLRSSSPPIGCVGAGTGLGEVYLTADPTTKEYQVWGSEGGHADFAPRNAMEFAMMEDAKNRDGLHRVSIERIVSGSGIPNIYRTLDKLRPGRANAEVRKRLVATPGDFSAIVSRAAESGQCPVCVETIDAFVGLYGAEAGNMALKLLPFGGMYIAGGIAPKLMWAMKKNEQFVKNFLEKGRMRTVLEKVPVIVVKEEHVGLMGSRFVCRRLAAKGEETQRVYSKLKSKL